MLTTFTRVLILLFQLGLTFVLLLGTYMLYAILDNDLGLDGLFGLVVFQPLIGAAVSLLTIICCFVAGLPIRLNKHINNWWRKHFCLAMLGLAIGFVLLLLSLLPQFADTVVLATDGADIHKAIPDKALAITGWLMTAFCALHLYPPLFLTQQLKARI